MRAISGIVLTAWCALSAGAQPGVLASDWSSRAAAGAAVGKGSDPFGASPAAFQRPPKGGDVNTGPGSLAAAREFLKGRWLLESFEVRLPNEPIVTLKGGGILIYDEMGNLSINIRADEKSADILRAGGVDMRDGAITADGRTAIDIQNHTLTYIIKDQAPLVKGPLGTDRPRYWAVEGDMLILSTKDKVGQTVSVGRWRRSQ
jgi:hypothetical protein